MTNESESFNPIPHGDYVDALAAIYKAFRFAASPDVCARVIDEVRFHPLAWQLLQQVNQRDSVPVDLAESRRSEGATSGDASEGTHVGDWLANGQRSQPRPASATPMCWRLPIGEQPPVNRTGDSEMYVLQMIENGRTVVALWHALARTYARCKIEEIHLPDWAEPETYYDVITDVLQAAVHAGFDAEELCTQAITNQQGLWDEGQAMANRLRGPRP